MSRMHYSSLLVIASALLAPIACSADHKPGAGARPIGQAVAQPVAQPVGRSPMDRPLTAEELKARKAHLSKQQFHVTQEEGTEPPFRNEFWDNHQPGIYVDVVSGEPLFSSKEKFDSGTGWPSFWQPLESANVVTRTDRALFMSRTEVRSKGADSHLGHVFDDGPAPTGLRYCMNSASLRFVPAERLAAEGYGQYARLFPEVKQVGTAAVPEVPRSHGAVAAPAEPQFALDAAAQKAAEGNRAGVAAEHEVAVLAGGCFWGMEDLLRKQEGVVSTEVGYSGGARANPNYGQVTTGATGHAEAVKIVFDPRKLSFEKLVVYYFHIHDPTTLNRQEHDVGTQYRSAIFYQSAEQGRVAQAVKDRIDRSHKLDGPVVTQVVPAAPFWPAEEYHQKYLVKHPGGYQCHFERKWDL